METDEVVAEVLSLLESIRLPETDEEIARWFSESEAQQPSEDAESILVRIDEDPVSMMRVALEVIHRADERDLANAGAVLLAPLLAARPLQFAGDFERHIEENDSFRQAFSRASMTGVPLDVQKMLNAALLRSGADPRLVVEYDETIGED